MEHHLQKAWAEEAVENAYFQRIEAMVQAGDLDAASAILEEDLASLDTPLGQMCRDLSEEAVDIAVRHGSITPDSAGRLASMLEVDKED